MKGSNSLILPWTFVSKKYVETIQVEEYISLLSISLETNNLHFLIRCDTPLTIMYMLMSNDPKHNKRSLSPIEEKF